MTSKDSTQDQELLDRYRRASDAESAAPSDTTRNAILDESRRVASQLAAGRSSQSFDVSRPAANDPRWKLTAFGTAGAALLAVLLIAPRYWETRPIAQSSISAAPPAAQSVPPAAQSVPPAAQNAPAAENATSIAPAPKLASVAPSRRSESSQEETAALQSDGAPRDSRALKPAQGYTTPHSYTAPQNAKTEIAATNAIVPAPAPALRPVPAPPVADALARVTPPSAPSADIVGGLPASAGGAARELQGGAFSNEPRAAAARQRNANALEPQNLQSAAETGDVDQATLLLDQGAAVDARDALGRTPLLLAVAQNRPAMVRLLLARGADPNAADNAGLTPLQQAKNLGLRDIAALLQQKDAR